MFAACYQIPSFLDNYVSFSGGRDFLGSFCATETVAEFGTVENSEIRILVASEVISLFVCWS